MDQKPNAGDAPWKSDVLAFRKAIAGAIDAVHPHPNITPNGVVDTTGENDAVEQFKGKVVRWKMTFLGVNAKGELEFEESMPDKETFLSGVVFVNLSVTAEPGSLTEWQSLSRKSVVTCQATISIIGLGIRWNADKTFAGWMPVILLEKAKPVR